LPKGLKISMTANANKGTGIFSYSIKTEHLKTLIAQLKNISVADLEKAGTGTPKPTASTTRKQPPPKTVKQENTPGYWIDKGTLASTYGAEKSAIRHFKRAIKIDPMKPQAYFHLAVSYGEIGRYQEALVQIDKAIALDDQNGAYYYGRGRIYLLAGDQLSADRDFRQAAALGNNDADNYLRRVAPRAGE